MNEKKYGFIDDAANYVSSVPNKVISLFKSDDAPGDYTTRKASLARQQKLADMLSQMGAQEQAVSTAGGIIAPMSPMGALARGLTSFGGSYLSGRAAADEAALKKAGSEELAKAVAQFGKPSKVIDKAAPDVVEPGGEPVQQYIMKTPDSGEMLAEASRIMASGLPGGEAIGAKLYSTASDTAERETAYNKLKPSIDAITNPEIRKYLNIAAMADPTKAAAYFGDVAKELSTPTKPNEAPTSVQEFTFAQTPAGGNFKGTYPEWVEQKARSGRAVTQVNVGPTGIDYGKPEDGLVWAREPNGTVKLDNRGAPIAIPYQGGKAFLTKEQVEKKAQDTKTQQNLATSIIRDDIRRAKEVINKSEIPVTGIAGAAARRIPGTQATVLQGILTGIKARIGFDELQKMRQNSPTGGALGNVSDKDIALVQGVYGDLTQATTQEAILYNLDRLEKVVYKVVNGDEAPSPKNRPPLDTFGGKAG